MVVRKSVAQGCPTKTNIQNKIALPGLRSVENLLIKIGPYSTAPGCCTGGNRKRLIFLMFSALKLYDVPWDCCAFISFHNF